MFLDLLILKVKREITCYSSKIIENNYVGISFLVFLPFVQFELNLAHSNSNLTLQNEVNEEFHPAKSGYMSHAIAVIYTC